MNNADFQNYLNDCIDRALAEDLGEAGDITSQAIFSDADTAHAIIKAKSPGVLSGAYLIRPLFARVDPRVAVDVLLADGDPLLPGALICRIAGPIRAILRAERIVLNFLQRLSGIATLTARHVAAIAHTRAVLLDTRKTVPTLRPLEKKAVLHGGGMNHRFGLFDMMLIKDTHVKHAGGVTAALKKALAVRGAHALPAIEIEVQTLAEFEEALPLCPDRIMLDNMGIADLTACVERKIAAHSRVELEASGSITLDTIAAVAETGVDFISCGAITHSAPALDIHLVIV